MAWPINKSIKHAGAADFRRSNFPKIYLIF